jgi:hypothetical protein
MRQMVAFAEIFDASDMPAGGRETLRNLLGFDPHGVPTILVRRQLSLRMRARVGELDPDVGEDEGEGV